MIQPNFYSNWLSGFRYKIMIFKLIFVTIDLICKFTKKKKWPKYKENRGKA